MVCLLCSQLVSQSQKSKSAIKREVLPGPLIQPKPRPRVAAFVSPPPRPQPRAAWAGAFPDAPPPWAPLAVPAPVPPPPTPSAPDAWPQPQRRSSSFSHPTCKYCRTPTPAPLSLRAPVVVCLLCRSSQSLRASTHTERPRCLASAATALLFLLPPHVQILQNIHPTPPCVEGPGGGLPAV